MRAIRDGQVRAEAAVMLGNRPNCRSLAEQFGVDWHSIGDDEGVADDERLIELCDQYEIDYLVLARYMRVLPAASCWKYAGGRIINLHHGLLPSFPGHPALSRGVRQPHADLRRDVPLHRARARRRQPDHLPVDVHRPATA